MTEKETQRIIDKANQAVEESSEAPMSLQEFIDKLVEDPNLARNAHQYLLDAIRYFGRRKVFEKGEEKKRYRFFDDPANDGEHAVFGNTDVLNQFVRNLEVVANSSDRMQKIILFVGPTATGKSEFKRCIVNGLREYSKTEEGKRYTCEWNSTNTVSRSDMTYGEPQSIQTEPGNWKRSPVQTNPISVVPKDVRDQIEQKFSGNKSISTGVGLDPLSQKEYDEIHKYYENEDGATFDNITDPQHFRARRYIIDETQGVGILTSEDDGSVKEKLLGSWMQSMLRELDSVGEKDPRAFSYDGVISQGNNGVSIVEDATKHIDVLVHLLNLPDESHTKIDKEIGFDVDTVPIFISNPDLLGKLQGSSTAGSGVEDSHKNDPMKAIKRRIIKYGFRYLTGLSNEARLLRKEIQGFTDDLRSESVDISDPMIIDNKEFAPHTIESVGLYNVITRLSDNELSDAEDLDLVDKALLYDRGYVDREDGGRLDIDDVDVKKSDDEGKYGIPVTYSRDVISNLVYSSEKDVYLPQEIIESLKENLSSTPVFSGKEANAFEECSDLIVDYIYERQEEDVIESILHDRNATEDAIEEYVDNLYEWYDDGEYDEYLLYDFERKHLGTDQSDYTNQEPDDSVSKLRVERIIRPINRYHWRQRNKEFELSEIEFSEIPALSSIIGNYSWSDVFSTYPNLDIVQWENPPENTETDRIKSKCVENMVDELEYSERSAEMTSEMVVNKYRDKLLNIKQDETDS